MKLFAAVAVLAAGVNAQCGGCGYAAPISYGGCATTCANYASTSYVATPVTSYVQRPVTTYVSTPVTSYVNTPVTTVTPACSTSCGTTISYAAPSCGGCR